MPEALLRQFEEHKKDYKLVFFFDPLPQELYHQTEVRYETWPEAMRIHQALLDNYIKSGFNVIHVPFDTIENRTDFVLKCCT